MPFAATWMDLESVILSEVSQTEKEKYCMTSLVCCCCSCLAAKSCPILCKPMDCSPPGSSVQRISQARMLEWVASSFSRGSSHPRDQIHASCIGRWIFCHGAIREAWIPYMQNLKRGTTDELIYKTEKDSQA